MSSTGGGGSRNLILAAMIFAVSMTFIDQTIVSIAAPEIQKQLHLTSTGVQWAINAYLLSLAALFAFGGRLADTVGHRKMVTLGVIVFAAASAMCGLTPKGSLAEAWIVTFRVIQGAGGAIMFPAALAIVVHTFSLHERGRALAIFFGISGGLTAIGPILGGYLTQWTWRAIFWVNIPVAVIALLLIVISKPVTVHRPGRIDYRGLALIASGVGLSVFGFQQSSIWGWGDPAIWICIAAGVALLIAFYFVELKTAPPLMQVRIFRIRPFFVENLVLAITMLVFIPVFFFASEYAQIALDKSPTNASLVLLYFFIGFVVAAQIGGRMLDRGGAKRPVVLGCLLGAVGFWLWAGKVTGLTSTPRSGTSSSPARAWASCSGPQARTQSTGPRRSPTARRPASPKPSATTRPALAWRSSARSSSHSCTPGSSHPYLAKACRRPARTLWHRASPTHRAAAGASPRFPISCGSTSPTPPARCCM